MKKIFAKALVASVALGMSSNISAQTLGTPINCFTLNDVDHIIAYDISCGTDVFVPASITGIQDNAFKNLGITSLRFVGPINYLGNYAFYGNKLTQLVLPLGTYNIGDHAFENNKLSQLHIENNTALIGQNAFANNNLTTLTIGARVSHIGPRAFAGNMLTSVKILDEVEEIGERAFINNQIKTLQLGKKVKHIGDFAFSYDYSNEEIGSKRELKNTITTLKLPNSVKFIGNKAFFHNSIERLEIPSSLEIIQSNAFSNNKITELIFEEGIRSVGDSAFYGNQLTTVNLPNSLINIPAMAFAGNKIKTLQIPETVLNIGYGAFENNVIETLNIHKNIELIGPKAFRNNMISQLNIDPANTKMGFSAESYMQNWIDGSGPFDQNCLRRDKMGAFELDKLDGLYNAIERTFSIRVSWDGPGMQKNDDQCKNVVYTNPPKQQTEGDILNTKITNLPNINNITLSHESQITDIYRIYVNISDDERMKITRENHTKLAELKQKIDELKIKQSNNHNSSSGAGGAYFSSSQSADTYRANTEFYINSFREHKDPNLDHIEDVSNIYSGENYSEITPLTTLFPKFVKSETQTVKTLTDPKLKSLQERFNATTEKTRNQELTRGEFLKIVIDSSGIDMGEIDDLFAPYKDISKNTKYSKYILFATQNRIVSGYHDRTFRPESKISRAEATKILVQSAGIKLTQSQKQFHDVAVTDTLSRYIQTAFENHLVNGVSNTSFEPYRGITRGELIKIIYNILN